jgi:UDPglucose--hexose-1-phosphate uridylyltransferase
VFVFENRGEAIGVTMRHPHGQIYAYPFVTPHTRAQLESIGMHGPSSSRTSVVRAGIGARRAQWRALTAVPSPRWPIEVHMLPHCHIPDFAATSEAEETNCRALPAAAARHEALRHPDALHRGVASGTVSVSRGDIRLML